MDKLVAERSSANILGLSMSIAVSLLTGTCPSWLMKYEIWLRWLKISYAMLCSQCVQCVKCTKIIVWAMPTSTLWQAKINAQRPLAFLLVVISISILNEDSFKDLQGIHYMSEGWISKNGGQCNRKYLNVTRFTRVSRNLQNDTYVLGFTVYLCLPLVLRHFDILESWNPHGVD